MKFWTGSAHASTVEKCLLDTPEKERADRPAGRSAHFGASVGCSATALRPKVTRLAVVIGTIGVWLGFPLADPIIGLLITIAIFGIVWQSARSVLTRMLDGVEPGVMDEIRHAAAHVPEARIVDAKARWVGHKLHADVAIGVDESLPLSAANKIASALEDELFEQMPALSVAHVRFATSGRDHPHDHSHHSHGHGH